MYLDPGFFIESDPDPINHIPDSKLRLIYGNIHITFWIRIQFGSGSCQSYTVSGTYSFVIRFGFFYRVVSGSGQSYTGSEFKVYIWIRRVLHLGPVFFRVGPGSGHSYTGCEIEVDMDIYTYSVLYPDSVCWGIRVILQ